MPCVLEEEESLLPKLQVRIIMHVTTVIQNFTSK
jgi:hypothetical protein